MFLHLAHNALRDGIRHWIGPVFRIDVPDHSLHLVSIDLGQDVRICSAIGRPEEHGLRFQHVRQQCVGGVDFVCESCFVEFGKNGVTIAVIANDGAGFKNSVTCRGGCTEGNLIFVVHGSKILADFKENRMNVILLENGEHLVGVARVRSVIEGQCNSLRRKF